jgi:hypothetical protein
LDTLESMGWGPAWAMKFEPFADGGLCPGRVFAEQREIYVVQSQHGEALARVSGRLRHEARQRAAFPAVGDWVAIDATGGPGQSVIHALVPRLNRFSCGRCTALRWSFLASPSFRDRFKQWRCLSAPVSCVRFGLSPLRRGVLMRCSPRVDCRWQRSICVHSPRMHQSRRGSTSPARPEISGPFTIVPPGSNNHVRNRRSISG